MTRKHAVALCLAEAAHGRPEALVGLLSYLLIQHQIPADRLIALAKRQFSIPNELGWKALCELQPTFLQ